MLYDGWTVYIYIYILYAIYYTQNSFMARDLKLEFQAPGFRAHAFSFAYRCSSSGGVSCMAIASLLGGSWVVISGVISPVLWVISI